MFYFGWIRLKDLPLRGTVGPEEERGGEEGREWGNGEEWTRPDKRRSRSTTPDVTLEILIY